MLKAMRAAHLRERLAVGRPLTDGELLLPRADGTRMPVRDTPANSPPSAPPPASRQSRSASCGTRISRGCAAGIAADVVAAWHGHTERMTQAVYRRVTDDRMIAASAVFSSAVGQIQDIRRLRSGGVQQAHSVHGPRPGSTAE